MFEPVLNFFKGLYFDYRSRKASHLRSLVIKELFFEDAKAFFEGKRTKEESLAFQIAVHTKLNEMSDEELLRRF